MHNVQTGISSSDSLYVATEREKILDFLRENSYLFPLLMEAYHHAKMHFPGNSVRLELATDPEIPNTTQLIVRVVTPLNPKEASQKLRELDKQWWLGAMSQAQGKMLIDIAPT